MTAAERPCEVDVEYRIEAGWLVEVVNEHTCGTGPDGYYGAHEPGCGMVPIADISSLLAAHDAQVRADTLRSALHEVWLRIHNSRFDEAKPDSLYNGVTRSERIVAAFAREHGIERVYDHVDHLRALAPTPPAEEAL